MNNVILTQEKLQSINDVNITVIASNKLRGYAIRLSVFYVCDYTHDEIHETIFSREELHYNEFVPVGSNHGSLGPVPAPVARGCHGPHNTLLLAL